MTDRKWTFRTERDARGRATRIYPITPTKTPEAVKRARNRARNRKAKASRRRNRAS